MNIPQLTLDQISTNDYAISKIKRFCGIKNQ